MYNRSTLFLDRDGVINKKLDGRYVCSFKEFLFMPGSLSAISKLSDVFQFIIIITNLTFQYYSLIVVNNLLKDFLIIMIIYVLSEKIFPFIS